MERFQSTHSLRSATDKALENDAEELVSIHALLAECDEVVGRDANARQVTGFNPRTPCGVRLALARFAYVSVPFQSTHSLRSATEDSAIEGNVYVVSIHALLAECDRPKSTRTRGRLSFNPRTPCGVRQNNAKLHSSKGGFQSTHSLRSATAPDLIHCYSTEQIILCANLPKKTVIARLLFLSIYLSIFYSQCITPIADLPGNSCELEVGAQAMFNSL